MNQLKHFMVVVSAALAASLLLATVAYAEDRDDDVNWGVFPDHCTFEVEHSGHVTIIGPEDYVSEADKSPNSNADKNLDVFNDEEYTPEPKELDVIHPSWIRGYSQLSGGFSYPEMDLSAYADEIFRITNEERVKAGLGEVERRSDVDSVAVVRAQELSEIFSHTRPNGELYTSLLDEYDVDYQYAGENAGMVPATSNPAGMINMWINSEGHKKNLLNPKHTGLGIGVYQVGQMVYCSQMFVY